MVSGVSRPENVFELRGHQAPHNLPTPLTSFIGRERELSELQEALAGTRLLTLTGAGGCGKTRLALEAASRVLGRFPDGVWWVELAPLGAEQLVGAAIAQAVGVRPLPGMTALQAVGGYLSSRRALVVLDNCEHLLAACAEAAESLLQAAPELVVLATGRAPLGVAGEVDWRVPSLSLPEPGGAETSDAVRLFVDRAGNARPGFELGAGNAEAIVRICSDLDGLPLAIELAAARVRMLSAEQIAAGVSDRFRLLTGGPRTATPRQQTLRASVDWSHDLLSEAERVLLRRVAVFSGGFSLAAVEQICAGDGIERDELLDLLASLVDQSLVIAEERPEGERYRLLETVRQYGLERLAAAGEEGSLRDGHRDLFLALAERAAPELETGRHYEWIARLDSEAANLAAAIDRALAGEPPLALRFGTALCRWWCAHGRFTEAEWVHSSALEACGDREPALRARLLQRRAYVANAGAGKFDAAESHATGALALAAEVGDQATAARARCELGVALRYANPRAGRAELRRAAELAVAAADDWAFVNAKQQIATTYLYQHDVAGCAGENDEVAALAERLGDPLQVSRRWLWVGYMAGLQGGFAEARDASARMRAALGGFPDPALEAFAAALLAFADIWEGDPERALGRLRPEVERALRLGAGLVLPWLLVEIAFAELAAGRPEQARGRLEGLLSVLAGRDAMITSWGLGLLAEALRLVSDRDAASTALQAQASGERIGNPILATYGRLTLGRLAAAGEDWAAAQQHALARLDACVEGGQATFVPGALDALAEAAAGLHAHDDAVRLFAAADRARAETGIARLPPEDEHWTAIDGRLRGALGNEAYEAARRQGAELGTEDALAWARRARGPRRRPPAGWASLTPTETKVVELVAEGLTNPEVAERMFVSPATVKTHLAHIFRKLDVHSRAELTARAVKHEQSS